MRETLPRPHGCTLLFLLATTAATAAFASPAPPTVIHHAAGETTVERTADSDHVVVKDAKGDVVSESYCEAGTFEAYRALFAEVQEALAKKDRAKVAKLFEYPLRVNSTKPITFRNEAALVKAYDQVFTAAVLAAVRVAEPAVVFCRNGEGMLGDGVLWATMSAKGARLVTINP